MKKEIISLILCVVCIVVTYAACMQIHTVDEMTADIGSPLRDNSDLRDEYIRWNGMANSLYKKLENLEKELEQIRSDASKDSQYDALIEEEIRINNSLLGLTELKGSGVKITLDDNREVSANEVLNINSYLVHDGDLLAIVNELFNAGADAVSINGHRVVNATSIYCDGNIIRINNEKTGVPIIINAIGYPPTLEYQLTRLGGYLRYMSDDGVKISIEQLDTIKIPKYNGIYSYNHIER